MTAGSSSDRTTRAYTQATALWQLVRASLQDETLTGTAAGGAQVWQKACEHSRIA